MYVTKSVEQFLSERKQVQKNDSVLLKPGVYLFHNKTKNKYYVGQSECPDQRVFSHLSGRGNGDVYHDYKLGDSFEIRFYTLNQAHFIDLNELEYHLIRIYEACELGYNRRAGNRTRNVS